jgi:hypothetical protein
MWPVSGVCGCYRVFILRTPMYSPSYVIPAFLILVSFYKVWVSLKWVLSLALHDTLRQIRPQIRLQLTHNMPRLYLWVALGVYFTFILCMHVLNSVTISLNCYMDLSSQSPLELLIIQKAGTAAIPPDLPPSSLPQPQPTLSSLPTP